MAFVATRKQEEWKETVSELPMHPSHLPLPCPPQLSAKDDLTRLTALTWLRVFVELYRGMLLLQYPSLLGVALANICHANTDIQQVRTPISCKGATLGVENRKRFFFGWEERRGGGQAAYHTNKDVRQVGRPYASLGDCAGGGGWAPEFW